MSKTPKVWLSLPDGSHWIEVWLGTAAIIAAVVEDGSDAVELFEASQLAPLADAKERMDMLRKTLESALTRYVTEVLKIEDVDGEKIASVAARYADWTIKDRSDLIPPDLYAADDTLRRYTRNKYALVVDRDGQGEIIVFSRYSSNGHSPARSLLGLRARTYDEAKTMVDAFVEGFAIAYWERDILDRL